MVNIFFKKYEEIPEEWTVEKLIDLCDEETRYGSNTSAIEHNTDLPRYIRITDILKDGLLRKDKIASINEDDAKKYLLKNGDIIFARSGSIGLTYLYKNEDGRCAYASYLIKFVPNPTQLNPKFLFHHTHSHMYWKWISLTKTKSTISNVNAQKYSQMPIFLPPILEQQKIASILSNVDNLIQNTEKIILQSKQLKKGFLQKLFTRGINHTKFKEVNLGKTFLKYSIPESWNIKKFGDILEINNCRVDMHDTEKYTRVIVKRRHEGMILRDIVHGKEILTKNQYRIKTGQFVISRRQIIHNACGLTPKEFDGALVSNEYSIFSGTGDLDINYFDLFSQSDIFKKTIVLTTQGVHIEKYIFLLDEWLQLSMPLPPLQEQQKILSIISNVDEKIQSYKRYREKLQRVKTSLMQKLLTGEVRVTV